MVGTGLPNAKQKIVIVPPSGIISFGWIVGGCWGKIKDVTFSFLSNKVSSNQQHTSTIAGIAGSVQATNVSDGKLSPFVPIATT